MSSNPDPWLAQYDEAIALEAAKPKLVSSREPAWQSTIPPADNLRPDSFTLKGKEPDKVWTYHAADGVPVGYVGRYMFDGKKATIPWTYGRLEGDAVDKWAAKGFSKPRPIYNLHEAIAHPERQLVIVEGEKCADAAAKAFPHQVALTWPGGASAPQYADWSPLEARDRKHAILWPDCDDAGRKAMDVVGAKLFMMGYKVSVVVVEGEEPGWDIADAVDDGLNVVEFIRQNARAWMPAEVVEPEPESPKFQAPSDAPILPVVKVTQGPQHEAQPVGFDGEWTMQQYNSVGLKMDGHRIAANTSNITKVLGIIRAGQIWYDEFLQKIMTADVNGGTREWRDADDIHLLVEIQSRIGMVKACKTTVKDSVIEHAYKDTRNELQDWLRGIQWDNVPRIETFFLDLCGAQGSSYLSAVSRNFFISLVARAMYPGCQVDNMIILEGRQGMFKSRLLRELGGRWYTVMRSAPQSKDFEITLQGKWLVEIAEMDSFSKSDVSATKRTLTTPTDRYRAPYGTHAEEHPRQSVFAGSVNRDDWNTDETGARRFWPIEVKAIDIDAVRRDREQFFAEAMQLLEHGAQWWKVPEIEATAQQNARYAEDPWAGAVEYWCKGRSMVVCADVLSGLGVPVERHDKPSQMRITAILRSRGWTKKAIWSRAQARPINHWVRQGHQDEIEAAQDSSLAPLDELPPVDMYGSEGD